MKHRRRHRQRRRFLGVMIGSALLLVAGFALVHVMAAARAGSLGRGALTRAEANLSARQLDAARTELDIADAAFNETRAEIDALGPIAGVARWVPVLGNHVKAVDTFANVGISLSTAAHDLVDAADTIINPPDERLPISAAMAALRDTQRSLGPASAAITKASDDVAKLKGWFLIGPLGAARDDLVTRLPRIKARATSADHGLSALIAFAGGSQPRRYLFLSQNPDEVRPTGGFIGTYGLFSADGGVIKLDRYDDIHRWAVPRPQADVPIDQVGPPYQYHNPPLRRTIANVNTGPHWPQAAELAANLWRAGGEGPVDGVISFTPAVMGRILGVVGPVSIPAFGETVSAQNIIERLDFHTHHDFFDPDRKDFVGVVAEAVLRKLLDAPASQWEPLGQAMGEAFNAREAVAWASDPAVASILAERRWDGAFPSHTGDFFFNSEFEYQAKNGRGIRRVYDHDVVVRADGSARVTTRLTLTNTEPSDPFTNVSSLAYMTVYGPEGAQMDPSASDALSFHEPALAGHPAAGWFKAAPPGGGQTTLTVVWDVPQLLTPTGKSTWQYALRWRNLPDHSGDVVHLRVQLPASWTWNAGPPPPEFSLDREMIGTWSVKAGG
jgi:hypothetical protein